MNKKSAILIGILSLSIGLASSNLVFAETIALKSGKTIEAKILEKAGKYIKVDIEGIPIIYFADQIESIDGKPFSGSQSAGSGNPSDKSIGSSLPSLSGPNDSQDLLSRLSPAIVYIDAKDGGGAGFIVDSSGVIATALHCLFYTGSIQVRLKDGTTYPIESIIYYDASRDFCLFKINARDLPVVSLGDSDHLQMGQKIIVIGHPYLVNYLLSECVFKRTGEFEKNKVLMISGPLAHGDSGGPAFDAFGRVVGLITKAYGGVSSTGEIKFKQFFAVPINEVKAHISTKSLLSLEAFKKEMLKMDKYYICKATDALENHNPELGIMYLNIAINLNPNNAVSYAYRGLFYGLKNKFEAALSDFDKAIQFDPDYVGGYEGRARLYAMSGKYDRAYFDYSKALQIDPFDGSNYFGRGIIDIMRREADAARADIRKAEELGYEYDPKQLEEFEKKYGVKIKP